MKVAVCSDLHLEFGSIELKNTEGADVLILSGDILVAADLNRPERNGVSMPTRYSEFMDTCSRNFPKVIYIMGNHEHYHGDYAKTSDILREFCSVYPNVHFLDNECIKIGDFTFVGGTLWTDMNKEDPMTLHAISGMMNDFRIVKNSLREVKYKSPNLTEDHPDAWKYAARPATFSPEDAVKDHRDMMEYLKLVMQNNPDEQIIVCGHHAPSKLSTHPRYKDDTLMNGAYSSELSEFILDHRQIKLWTHGHTHEPFDYMLGTTRVVCNPRGYIDYEERADQFELKFVEV